MSINVDASKEITKMFDIFNCVFASVMDVE